MSILQLPPARVEPRSHGASSTGATGSAAALPEAPFAAILQDERTRPSDRIAADRGDARGSDTRDDDASTLGGAPSGDDAAETAAATATATGATTEAAPVAAPIDPMPAVATAAPVAPAADAPTPALLDGASAQAPATATATATAAPVTPEIAAPAATPGASATVPASASTAPNGTGIAAQPASTESSAPQAGTPGEVIANPQSGSANPQSVAPRATPVHDGTPSSSLPHQPQIEASNGGSPVATDAESLAKAMTAKTAAAVAEAGPPGAAPTPTAGPTAATAPVAPVVPAAPPQQLAGPAATATLPTRGVGLDRAVETVRLALRAAADRGVTQARISLNPRELGGIEIHLRHTAEGLVARVVAEHAGAAQLLQHAGAELRRSLEAQGVTLLQLDIGASGEQSHSAAGEQRGFGEAGDRRDGSARTSTADDPAESLAADGTLGTPDQTLALSNGVLVDVLA